MCDRIHTAEAVDGLPILVELVQYPDHLDNDRGDHLARRLSELASAAQSVPCASPCATLLPQLDAALAGLRACLCDSTPATPSQRADARRHALLVGAVALVLTGWLEPSPRARRAARIEAEVMHWLRRAIGEAMGRSGEAAVMAVSPSMKVGLVLSIPDFDPLEAAIRSRWGVSLEIGVGSSVAELAAAIVTANQKSAT